MCSNRCLTVRADSVLSLRKLGKSVLKIAAKCKSILFVRTYNVSSAACMMHRAPSLRFVHDAACGMHAEGHGTCNCPCTMATRALRPSESSRGSVDETPVRAVTSRRFPRAVRVRRDLSLRPSRLVAPSREGRSPPSAATDPFNPPATQSNRGSYCAVAQPPLLRIHVYAHSSACTRAARTSLSRPTLFLRVSPVEDMVSLLARGAVGSNCTPSTAKLKARWKLRARWTSHTFVLSPRDHAGAHLCVERGGQVMRGRRVIGPVRA